MAVETFDSPAHWAAKKRRLGNDSAQAGLFNNDLTPYMQLPYEAFLSPDVRKITICCGAQMGKTDFLLNLAGYTLDVDPKTIMFVEPTEKLAQSISSDRFAKMAKSVGLRTEGKSKVSEKHYNGTKVIFAWASSASQLVSHPVCIVLIDERDQMKANVDGQGDPYALAEARTTTYPNHKIVATSTPTLRGSSAIYKLFMSSNAYKWAIPCSYCRNLFIPCFELFRWLDTNGIVSDAWLECSACKKEVRMIDNLGGGYVKIRQGPTDHLGFWISGLVSPFRTLKQAAQQYLDAKNDSEETLKTCVNTVFGELYEAKGEKLDIAFIDQAKQFCKTDTIQYYTMGVDVQKDSLYYVIRAWQESTSWQYLYGQISGDTDDDQTWQSLDDLINKHKPKLTAIDSGYRTASVFNFCDNHRGITVPCKGSQNVTSLIFPKDRDLKYSGGRVLPHVSKVFHYDDSYFKKLLFTSIKNGRHWLLPTITKEYIDQLTAEELQLNGNKWVWVDIRPDNHYLDCEKLNIVAYEILQKFNSNKAPKAKIVSTGGINPYAK